MKKRLEQPITFWDERDTINLTKSGRNWKNGTQKGGSYGNRGERQRIREGLGVVGEENDGRRGVFILLGASAMEAGKRRRRKKSVGTGRGGVGSSQLNDGHFGGGAR